MSAADDQQKPDKPTEQRGGGAPGEQEAREKGPWAAKAAEGVVPAQLGGSDAPPELQGEDPELGSDAVGRTAASDEPATRTGIDLSAGDGADATSQGGPEAQGPGEPDLKDAATGPRQVDVDSAR